MTLQDSTLATPTSLSSATDIRVWMKDHHRKQLAVLDKFLLELRMGRLARSSASSSTSSETTTRLSTSRVLVTRSTVDLVRHLIGGLKWQSAAELLTLLRGIGKLLQAAGGSREPAIGNIVRRIMAAVREEAVRDPADANTKTASTTEGGGRLTLDSMLWALPLKQHRPNRLLQHQASRGDHQRQESFADEVELDREFPDVYYAVDRPELKSAVMEAMQEITTDLEDLHRSINEQATNHIHTGEIILTYGRSQTVEKFLKAAAAKKRSFEVIVAEAAPHYGGHHMAESLMEAGISTVVINDSAIFAVMARVNKVLLPAHAVLADGGLVSSSGCHLVATAAQYHAVPVMCLTGIFKLCPQFPHDGQDTLNDLLSPSSVLDYAELSDTLMNDVEFVNPVHDYIKPEYIDLYITNVGSFQPSFIYRLLAEYYHTDDWAAFD